jgi:hypothetical protein
LAKVLSDAKLDKDAAAAQAFAQIVGQHLSTTATGTSTYSDANKNYTISGLADGYYMVKDKNDSQSDKDGAYTRLILEVVKNVAVDPKGNTPTVEKKVKENVKTTPDDTNYGTGYNDVADYNIGDTIPFELIGTVSSDYANYTTYNYVFTDTASAGLTIDTSSVKV